MAPKASRPVRNQGPHSSPRSFDLPPVPKAARPLHEVSVSASESEAEAPPPNRAAQQRSPTMTHAPEDAEMAAPQPADEAAAQEPEVMDVEPEVGEVSDSDRRPPTGPASTRAGS